LRVAITCALLGLCFVPARPAWAHDFVPGRLVLRPATEAWSYSLRFTLPRLRRGGPALREVGARYEGPCRTPDASSAIGGEWTPLECDGPLTGRLVFVGLEHSGSEVVLDLRRTRGDGAGDDESRSLGLATASAPVV